MAPRAHALATHAQVTFHYAGGALGLQRAGAPGSVLPVADCHLQAAGASELLRSAAAALRACRQGGWDGAPAQRAAALRGLETELTGLVIRRGVDAAGSPVYMAVLQTGPPARAAVAAGRVRDTRGLDAGLLGRGAPPDGAGRPAAEAARGRADSPAVSAAGKGAGAGSLGSGAASGAAGGRRAAPAGPPAGAREAAAAGGGARGGDAGSSGEPPKGAGAHALAGARVLAERLAAEVPGLASVVLLPRAPSAPEAAARCHVAEVAFAQGHARWEK